MRVFQFIATGAGVVIVGCAAFVMWSSHRTEADIAGFAARVAEIGSAHPAPDVDPARIANLPAPVQRYFDYAFNGQTEVTLRGVRWREEGDFLLPVGEFRAHGGQVSRPDMPVYIWSGTFHRFGLPIIESRDAYLDGGHNMRAKLFGWITAMHTDYEQPEQIASLHSYLTLRYYGQAPLMPWALLPNGYVELAGAG